MKPNYKTTFAALALALLSIAHAGEAVTLTWKKDAPENAQTAVLTLAAGESAKVKWGGASSDGGLGYDGVRLNLTIGGTSRNTGLFNGSTIVGYVPLEVSGPATITLSALAPYDYSVATLEVTRVGTASPPAEVPQEAGSKFDVILEQSSDLLNWTPANPGEYTGLETKRFFRTRIVKK
jgi:hypothetical protein